jgi:hypothetical protein
MTKRFTGWRRRTQDKLPKGSESFAAIQLSVIARKLNGAWSGPVGVVHYVRSFLLRAGSTFVGPVLSPGLPFKRFASSGINLQPDDWGVTGATVSCEILERKEGRWKELQMVSTITTCCVSDSK